MKHPPEFLAKLGNVVVAWSLFEHNLGMIVIIMISPDIFTGQSVIKELRFRSLADAALNVYRAHIGEDDDFLILREIINRAEKLEPERNLLVHATFGAEEKGKNRVSVWKVSAKRKGIKRIAKFIEYKEIDQLGSDIHKLSDDLMELFQRLIASGKTKYIKMG
ncbi:MAG: hypothetical protein K0R17_1250 [Rariglobus sp.]|jgi:hypothetical protein|nr:hypothetical protein [Rariglobus sp.]